MRTTSIALAAIICLSLVLAISVAQEKDQSTQSASNQTNVETKQTTAATTSEESSSKVTAQPVAAKLTQPKSKPKKIKPAKIAPFVSKSIDWLSAAQHKNGGWGGGTHANQKEIDPHNVATDPATTAFATLALIRTGSTLESGPHKKQIEKATEYLLSAIEKAPDEGALITERKGTQIQAKLGGLVDTTMATQCLSRLLRDVSESHKLHSRIDTALDKCLAKLQKAQKADGSWNVAGGWAPVLQSSNGQQALEMAQAAGKPVSKTAIKRARDYQKGNVDVNGKSAPRSSKASAGVELYSFSGSLRGNSIDASFADNLVKDAKRAGRLEQEATISEDSLREIGVDGEQAKNLSEAWTRNKNQIERLNDKRLLKGFGNNGGEEFVSFLLTSESMIIAGGDKWPAWNDKMHGLFQKIQNQDGSWSGHHCITSPVFCTAAAIQCLTADRDAKILQEVANKATEKAKGQTEVEKKPENNTKNSRTSPPPVSSEKAPEEKTKR